MSQPENQLGKEISELLVSGVNYKMINIVSAFVGLRALLRLREHLLRQVAHGACLRMTIGIDLGGTSLEVLNELLRWDCETFIFHDAIPRATFHPKIYRFESESIATLFVGSNNFTDGGMYTNYEVATRHDFMLPDERDEYERIVSPLSAFLNPKGVSALRLEPELIETLLARGELPSDEEIRSRARRGFNSTENKGKQTPPNPFPPVSTARPPLLPNDIRPQEPARPPNRVQDVVSEPVPVHSEPQGILVWRKTLSRSDALQVNEGSNIVGGVRLTQARFENADGSRIDQTTYFRRLFDDYNWEPETGRKRDSDQEHAFIPMRIFIQGTDYGVRIFEVSHKPSGEAGQGNYTTMLRWGRGFSQIIQEGNLHGATFDLYETTDTDAEFLISIY